jgi:hypothetical protein
MNEPSKSSEKYAALREQGATPVEVFKVCKADGNKNWECQVLLMGIFDMSLDDARTISHSLHSASR